MLPRLVEAAMAAKSDDPDDMREAFIGAIGERADGAIVVARNQAVLDTDGPKESWSFLPAHAECRLAQKLDHGSVVFVARVRRDGSLAMSRPCGGCERVLRSRNVSKVYYTINDTTYGVWDMCNDKEWVVERNKEA